MRISFPLIILIALCVALLSFYLFPKPEEIGQALEQSGRLEEAVTYYHAALATNPSDEVTWVRVGNVYLLRGEPDSAIHAYRQLVELDPMDIGYRRQLAQLYDWSLQIEEAMVQKAKIAELDAKDVAVRQELANYQVLERKDYAAAIRFVEEIVAARPRDADALVDLAQLYSQTGQISRAIAVYERALEEDPTNPLISRGLAKVKAWNGQIEAAIAQNRAMLAADPDDLAALSALRELLRITGGDPSSL